MFQYSEHLPDVLVPIREFVAIGTAVDQQVSKLQQRIEQYLLNRYIDTADGATLQRMFGILGLVYNPDLTLDEQRSQIKARKQVRFIINLQRIRTMLAEITGDDATLSMDYDALLMTVRVALTSKHNFRTVQELLADTVPANVSLNVYLLYNQHSLLSHFTHMRLAEFTHKQLREDVLSYRTNAESEGLTHQKLTAFSHGQLRRNS